jgi:hypothetical protein
MGYIGNTPAEKYITLSKQTFTPDSSAVAFTLDNPVANENELAVFVNNVRQEPGSGKAYTATGTTLTMSEAPTSGHTMYAIYLGKTMATNTPADGSVTNDMISYPLTKSGATVATFNRTTDDGDIIELQKNGTKMAQIGVDFTDNLVISGNSTHAGLNFGTASVVPYKNGDNIDATIDWGSGSNRFKDLYLSGNIYLGGTGSANALDDYEEGTWTPSFEFAAAQPTAGNTTGTGFYTKVGNMVTVWGAVANANVTGASGDVKIRDLPFTSKASQNLVGWLGSFSVGGNTTFSGYLNCDVEDNTSTIRPIESVSGAGSRDILNVANCVDGATDVYFCVNYQVN